MSKIFYIISVSIDLSGISIWKGKVFPFKKVIECDLPNCDFTSCDLNACHFNASILKGCVFDRNTIFKSCKFINVDLSERNDLKGLSLQGVDFSGSNLSSCDLSSCNLSSCNLNGVNLKG